jgi:DNA-binding YbaB/EbfC family protein
MSDLPPEDEGLGGPDLGNLLSQAMEMQQQVMAAQAQAASTEVEGQAGGGAVRVVVTGAMEFRSVHIARAAVDPDDVDMLQDLVLAALHDAVARINDLQEQSLGGFGDALSGSGLGGMLGIGGGDLDDEFDDDGDDDDDERGV